MIYAIYIILYLFRYISKYNKYNTNLLEAGLDSLPILRLLLLPPLLLGLTIPGPMMSPT